MENKLKPLDKWEILELDILKLMVKTCPHNLCSCVMPCATCKEEGRIIFEVKYKNG